MSVTLEQQPVIPVPEAPLAEDPAPLQPLGAIAANTVVLDNSDPTPVQAVPEVKNSFAEQRTKRGEITDTNGKQILAQIRNGAAPNQVTIGTEQDKVTVDVAALRALTPMSRQYEYLRAHRIPVWLAGLLLDSPS